MVNHSITKSIALHLFPGLIILLIYISLTPWVISLGYPPLMSLLVSVFFGVGVIQLGHLLFVGYKLNGRLALTGLLLKNEKITPGKFILIVFIGFIIIALAGMAIFVFEDQIKTNLFSWLPSWYFFDSNFQSYSRNVLIFTALLRLIIDGLFIPIIEELYFRGYLLPRLPASQRYKPVMAAVMFSLYHFWQPWNYISLFIISLVLVIPVLKFRSIYLSIAMHTLVNIIGGVLFLLQVIAMK